MPDKIQTRWVTKRQFTAWDSVGHSLVMDGSLAAGGEGTGWRPVELLLTGLAGCTGFDVVSILEKKREDVRGLEIVVEGTPRAGDFPHYYETIEVLYRVTGVGVKPASVARAVELSEEKYCSVRATLGPQCEVKTKFEVIEYEVHDSAS